jgi:peptidoglycan/xylan/chitin deacetylase (PgdA/CDA1 family)
MTAWGLMSNLQNDGGFCDGGGRRDGEGQLCARGRGSARRVLQFPPEQRHTVAPSRALTPRVSGTDVTSFGDHLQVNNKLRIVTTSWDDGDYADLKLAELLLSKGIRGTFYVPIDYRERPLGQSDLRSLTCEGFEIGAHGWSQKHLWHLKPEDLAQEVQPCKRVLEDIIGREVQMFCYPRGRYDTNVVQALQKAGYRGARTVRMLATTPTFNVFEMPTTLQVFPHVRFSYFKNAARARSLETLRSCLVQMPRLGSWRELGKKLFDAVLEKGGVWHLFGHSWEIESLGLWDDLREILDYVCGRDDVQYVPNCALLQSQQPIASLTSQEPL